MATATRTSQRERLLTIAHYVTAFVIALEGVSHLEHRPRPWLFIALCWVSAVAVTVITSAHHRIEPHFPALQAVVHVAEGAVSSALVYLTHHEGKVGLPIAWAAAAVLLLGTAALELRHYPRRNPSPQSAPSPGKGTEGGA